MKIIYKIACVELRMLFCSPIAWLLLLCFSLQMGVIFTNILGGFVEGGYSYNASFLLFASPTGGLWAKVQEFIYMYIPLLTMGIVSKELSSGSVKLLYSSPISNAQIILGKFLSMVVYAALMMAVLMIFVIIGGCTIEHFEWGWVLTGLLGLFLMTCTYMAVGIFVSSLTTYQILAAVGTFVILMLLSMVKGWGQQYDIVRDITYWLSIDGRASTFIWGMLCSEDVLYFPVIAAFFLSLTIIRLNAVRQKQRIWKTLGQYGAITLVVCVVALVSSQPMMKFYYDSTHNKTNTITPVSQEIIKQATGGMTITSYVNVLDRSFHLYTYPSFIFANRKLFEKYARFKPELKLRTVYYYADPMGNNPKEISWRYAKQVCETYGMDSTMLKTKEEVDKMVDLSEEGYTFVRQITRESGEKEWLRVYSFGYPRPDEAEISAAIKRMVMKLPTLGLVQGHRERDIYTEVPYGYSLVGNQKKASFSPWNQGFDVKPVTLEQPIPEEIDMLAMIDPRSGLTPEEETVLQAYIDRGGSLFFIGDVDHREVQNPMLCKLLGVELTPMLAGVDVRHGKKLRADDLGVIPTDEMKEKMHQVFYGGADIIVMPACSGVEMVEDRGFTSHPFLICDTLGQYWTELETTDFEEDSVRFNPAKGEVSKSFTTLLGLTRMVNGKEQRILISGDADCMSNNEFSQKRLVRSGNQYLFLGANYWLSHERAPIDVRRPMAIDNRVLISQGGYKAVKVFMLWIFPILLLAAGVLIWLRRRGH